MSKAQGSWPTTCFFSQISRMSWRSRNVPKLSTNLNAPWTVLMWPKACDNTALKRRECNPHPLVRPDVLDGTNEGSRIVLRVGEGGQQK